MLLIFGPRGPIYIGPDVHPGCCVDLTDVTLADKDTNSVLREAIVPKIPEFYEIFSQTGGGVGQPDFISLIQILLSLSNHPFFKDPLI